MKDGWIGKDSFASAHLGNLKNAEAQVIPRWLALNFDKMPNEFDTFQ